MKLPETGVDPNNFIPGASESRTPIIPNIKKHDRKPSGNVTAVPATAVNGSSQLLAPALREIASLD